MMALLLATASLAPTEVVVFDAYTLFSKPAVTLEERRRQWDQLHLLSTLQGLANRHRPRLYINLVGDKGSIDRHWWGVMRRAGGWLAAARVVRAKDLDELLERFKDSYRGVVVWDERVPATSNVASTIAGVERVLPLRYDPSPDSLYSKLSKTLLTREWLIGRDGSVSFTGKGTIPDTDEPSTGSAKCDAYVWAIENHYLDLEQANPRKLGYYPDAFWLQRPNGLPVDRTLLSNHDYFVAKGGFFFDLHSWEDEAPDDDLQQPLGTDVETLKRILLRAYVRARGQMIHVGGFTPWDLKYTDFTGRKHGGVPTEWRYAEILSCYNAYMDADAPGLGPMANASFFMHFPLKEVYKQPPLPTDEEMRRQGWIDASGRPAKRAFAAFYVGDYDSAAWLYRVLPEVWDDPARGSVPLGWAFNPNLEERFPVGLHYARQTATPQDAFITGDSGAGYLNPGYLVPPRRWSGLSSGLDAWVRHSEPFYRRWDLRVTGFVIDGYAPPMAPEVLDAYARLSPGGVVAQQIPERSLVRGVPFLRMGSDLNREDLPWSVRRVADEAATPGFRLYRTILWSASKHKELVDKVRAERPDIVFVTAPVLLELVRREQASAP